jgi:hypothetical protein
MMNGGNIYDLQKVLGHTRLDLTQRYAHLAPEHLVQASKVMNVNREFFNGAQDWRAKISKLFIPKIKGLTSNFKELHQFSSFPVVVCFHLFLALFR